LRYYRRPSGLDGDLLRSRRANSFAHTDANSHAKCHTSSNTYSYAVGDTNGNAERNSESDTTTAPDTVSAPNTIAKGCNPFCGDSRNTLASSARVVTTESALFQLVQRLNHATFSVNDSV
jgi:hypothetical protein